MVRAIVIVCVCSLCVTLYSTTPSWAQEPTPADGQSTETAPPTAGNRQIYPSNDNANGATQPVTNDITGQFYYRVRRPVTSLVWQQVQVPQWVTGWEWDPYTCANVQVQRQVLVPQWQQVKKTSFKIEVFCKTITLRAGDVMSAEPCACSDSEFLNRRVPGNEYNAPPTQEAPPAAPPAAAPAQGSARTGHNHAAHRANYSMARNVNRTAPRTASPAGQNVAYYRATPEHSASTQTPAYWPQTQPVVYFGPTVPITRQ